MANRRPRWKVTVTHGMRGWFAVLLIDESGDGYWEPDRSGVGSYADRDGAVREARDWAEAEGVPLEL